MNLGHIYIRVNPEYWKRGSKQKKKKKKAFKKRNILDHQLKMTEGKKTKSCITWSIKCCMQLENIRKLNAWHC